MERRNFIKNASMFALGAVSSQNLGTFNYGRLGAEFSGYLMPISIDENLAKLFQGFKISNPSDASTDVVEKGIKIISDHPKVSHYKEHFEKIVIPQKNTKKLNGKGVNWTDKKIMTKMNDENVAAQTPVHHVRDLNTFDLGTWSKFCDISSLQTALDTSNNGRIYVTPLDNRKQDYQGTFWVPEKLSYMLYNPVYYCYGLPIEDPIRVAIDESTQRGIKEKTGKLATVSHYFTQTYFFQGQSACGAPVESRHTIYWDHDDVVKQFHNLVSIKGCGDPKIECQGDPAKPRPEIIPNKN